MNKKKIAIIGRGTAGAQAVICYLKNMPDCDIEWHYDPNISPQAVGEGADLNLPRALMHNMNFDHLDLDKIGGTFKSGIYKPGWNSNGTDFFHEFPPPSVSYHFNALELQNYIHEYVKPHVKIVEHNTSADNIDADFVMDCSGKPKNVDNDDFIKPKYIPVNAVHVTQCDWDFPNFQYTIAAARPHGWVFLIPLKNRCSVGYLYNHSISSLEDVKEDVKNIFDEYNLNPSDKTNSFHFDNYYRKQNFQRCVTHNGNSSFFLEPLEATSISVMLFIQRSSFHIWNNNLDINMANIIYHKLLLNIENFIMMHYFAGSKFKSPFWDFAKERGRLCMESAARDSDFVNMVLNSKHIVSTSQASVTEHPDYANWWIGSFFQNINGLGIGDDLNKALGI